MIRLIFCLFLVSFSIQTLLSQSVSSKNNYTGNWNDPQSWAPTWSQPSYTVSGINTYINGYITADSSLVFTGTSSTLFVVDTLEINGNLTLGNNNILRIETGGVLVVHGNLSVVNKTELLSGGSIIIEGDFVNISSVYDGSFSSTNNPSRVFIFGMVPDIDYDAYPVLDCSGSDGIPYLHSGCNYGNLVDLQNDPMYAFFQSTCNLVIQASFNSTLCTGDALTLNVTGGISWQWSGPMAFTSTEQNPVITEISGNHSGMYKVTAYERAGCIVSDSVNVVISGYSNADAGPDQVLQNEYITNMSAILPNDATGQWSVISGSGVFDVSGSPVTRITDLSAGTNVFRWLISVGSCSVSNDVQIVVHDRFIPSVITPNNDSKNEFFILRGLVGPVELIIFDRSGKIVYSQISYENNWNGYNNNNRELPDDTYYYIIKTGDGQVIKGSVLIKR